MMLSSNRRWRRGVWVGIAVVLLAAMAWAVADRRNARAPSPATAAGATSIMQGMTQMPGMSTSANGSVQLTANQIREFGVTFGIVDVRPLGADVRAVGTVTFDERSLAQIAPKFGGYVEQLYVNTMGQPVRRGEALASIYSPELVAAEQELLLAGRLDRAVGASAVPGIPADSSNLLDAARRRLQLLDISDAQIDAILRTGHVRRTLTLYAPVSGVVVQKKVVQGQAIQPGMELFTIANLSTIWVDVDVREADAGRVRTGSPATIELAAFPGRPVKGRVQYLYPTLDSTARTARARIAVPNSDGQLKPGMYATVHISTPGHSALTVPASAVLRTGDRSVVFVDMGGGQLMPQEVELGRVGGEYVEALSGLEPGQRVVTSAQFLLDSESNLAEVMKSMVGQMNASDMNQMGDMKGMPGMDTSGGDTSGMNAKGAPMKNMPGMPMPADTSRR
jgi:Cu(I)/Ag(I) efflux system membrane fusion protein